MLQMSTPTSSSPPADPLKNFDCNLQTFYHTVLCKELDALNKRSAKKIKSALKEVVEAYRRCATKRCPTTLRFDTSAKRCGYVLKHSPCFTSAVARHFQRLISNNRQLLKLPFLNGELKICCLGGGPASDAVAIAKVVSGLYHPYWYETGQPLRFDVSIVDLNEDWEVTARYVLETLREDDCLLGVEGVKLSFRFVQADLTQPMDTGVRDVIRRADILTMVYFLSAVNEGRDKPRDHSMIKEIMRNLKKGAFLFFLDSAADLNYRQMLTSAETLDNLEQIYGPQLEDFHCLSLSSAKKFLELYKNDFGRFICMTNCFVSSCAWYKHEYRQFIKMPTPNDFCIVEQNDLWREIDLKKTTRMTTRMLSFRAAVQRILAQEFGKSDFEIETWSEDIDDLDDYFDSVMFGHSDFVPDYFFQTKSKKKRIFTGLPLSI